MPSVLTLSRATYSNTANNLLMPSRVHATKANAGSEWQYGDARNAAHQKWWIRDHNLARLEPTPVVVHFDVPIAPNWLSLSDDPFINDALTKRILCIRALEFGIRATPKAADGVLSLSEMFDWWSRWKHAKGISRSGDLTSDDFQEFCISIQNGRMALVDVYGRLDEYIETVALGKEFPMWRRQGEYHVHWTYLAKELGVSSGSLRSRYFKAELLDRLSVRIPYLAAKLANGLFVENLGARTKATEKTLDHWFGFWSDLHRLSEHGHLEHDPVEVNVFEVSSPSEFAAKFGAKGGRTTTLPPELLLKVMDKAVEWIFEYGDWILGHVAVANRLSSVAQAMRAQARQEAFWELDKTRPSGAPRIDPTWIADALSPNISVGDALEMLKAACGILVCAFGARRLNEGNSLQEGCLQEVSQGLYELSIYIEKTLREVDAIPVPNLMLGVVDVLERMSEPARTRSGEKWLFRVLRKHGASSRNYVAPDITKALRRFVEFNLIEVPPGFEDWTLAAHELRRGFAIVYHYGFELSDLDSLSWFLRHFNPEMTRVYVREVLPGQMARLRDELKYRREAARQSQTEDLKKQIEEAEKRLRDLRDRAATWEEVRTSAIVHKLLKLFRSEDKVVGQGGAWLNEQLAEMVAKARAMVRVTSRLNSPEVELEHVIRLFKQFAAKVVLDPLPGRRGHCTYAAGTNLTGAKCLDLKAAFLKSRGVVADTPVFEPDFLFSGSHPCLQCRFHAMFVQDVETVENDIAARKASAADVPIEGLRLSLTETLDELVALVDRAKAAAMR
jgi:hypothetical protein